MEFGIFGFLGFWIFGFLDFWIFGFLDFWIFGFLDFWIFGFLDFWIFGFLDFWAFGFLGFWVLQLCFQSVETDPKLDSEKGSVCVGIYSGFEGSACRRGGIYIYTYIYTYIYIYIHVSGSSSTDQLPTTPHVRLWPVGPSITTRPPSAKGLFAGACA